MARRGMAIWNACCAREITRVAGPDGRVIFRTAGEISPLERKLPADILAQWRYLPEESRDFHRQDRSSIYGGFHIYERAR